jgi:hypothetical protein
MQEISTTLLVYHCWKSLMKHWSEKVIIPELHIIQGFVNHLFWDGIVPLLGRENSMKWP